MAIRIRKVDGHWVALCAAETKPKKGDIYLDDVIDHALRMKFLKDYKSEGLEHLYDLGLAPFRGYYEKLLKGEEKCDI